MPRSRAPLEAEELVRLRASASEIWTCVSRSACGMLELGTGALLDLYRAYDRRLARTAAGAVPIVHEMWNVLHCPNVEGIWTHPLGIGVLDEVVVHRGATIGGS